MQTILNYENVAALRFGRRSHTMSPVTPKMAGARPPKKMMTRQTIG